MTFVKNFIIKIFGGNAFLATFFISMVPLIELKGAIPFGMSKDVFESALSPLSAWAAASVGSFVPAILLVWLFVPIINWLKKTRLFRGVSNKLENKFKGRAEKIKGKTFKKCLGLCLFVAIPLPLTGAYTGSAVAAFLGLNYLTSLICILIGNIIAGGIVVALCTIFVGFELYIFWGFIALIALIIIVKLIASAFKKSSC